MSFKLGAYILNLKKGGGSWALDDLKSIGIWEGSEIISGVCPEGALTGIVTEFENTVVGFAHAALEISAQVTLFPLESDEDENVFWFVPVFTPLICH